MTLEYSLADAGPNNPDVLCTVWESLFKATPRTLNRNKLGACGGDHAAEVLAVWRGICLADSNCSKAEFAQALAAHLESRDKNGDYLVPTADFVIPGYLQEAFQHVLSAPTQATN